MRSINSDSTFFFLHQQHEQHHYSRLYQLEAIEETKKILFLYKEFIEETLAIPIIEGIKTDREKFAGAIETYCVEALMQDGKALQAGTSHFLGQNFAKAFDVKFANRTGSLEYVWASSWGVSTRLIGALVMTHSDDRGLILPPKLAPYQVVLIPIYHNDNERSEIIAKMKIISKNLRALGVRVKEDFRDTYKPGWKFSEYELKGVPIRIGMGPRDLANQTVEVARRDTFEKQNISINDIESIILNILETMQNDLFLSAKSFRDQNTFMVNDLEEFKEKINLGGFVLAHWDGTSETEDEIKKITKATIRCIPFSSKKEAGECIFSGKPSNQRVIFAKSY